MNGSLATTFQVLSTTDNEAAGDLYEVNGSLATTFQVLTTTGNEAAVRVLIPALDSPNAAIQEGALRAILARRSRTGHREVVRRLHSMPDWWAKVIAEQHGRMAGALRDAILSTDRQMCVNGCRAAVWFCEYDLAAAVLNVMENRTSGNADVATETLLALVGGLYEEVSAPRDLADRRDPQFVRRHVLESLELSFKRYPQHQRREVIEAFLMLAGRDNVVLNRILQDPHHPVYLPMIDLLSNSSHDGIMRLLLSFLDDPHAPSAAISLAAKRSDPEFIRSLLRKIGREPAFVVRQNLHRIQSVSWLGRLDLLDQFDDAAQHATIRLAMYSSVSRLQVFATVEHLLLRGKPGGRREAALALETFNGAAANALAIRALDDPDPQVQANVAGQLRRRGIPGILSRLLTMMESPHEEVRSAVRGSLEEFTFERFVGAFDMLDEEVRRSTGIVVKKVDRQATQCLLQELKSIVRTRRLRGLAIARALELVEQVEPTVIDMLRGDEDHMVRVVAAGLLGDCTSQESLEALFHAGGDSSTAVVEAARESIEQRVAFIPRHDPWFGRRE